ncbi:MAG: oligosaccharide flippase family protein, partial [Flavobacteriaceae bacterium]|nr:oligosaccharide flippase family protein [Flavobacteriaceae bacterium]
MKIPKFIRENLLLKMTSLNAGVIGVRLVISLFIQRLLAELVGEAGIAKIGQLRNMQQLLTSFSSVGIFNGIVKYIAEYKKDQAQLQKLFSTSLVFWVFGSLITGTALLIFAEPISERLFGSLEFVYLIQLLAIIVPFIGIQRIFNGVVNGLSMYKKFAKIDLLGYLISAVLTVIFLLQYNIDGALVAIAIT